LSPQENSILQCLIKGDSNKVIARKLQITEATVKAHVKAILRKVQVQNRTQAAIWAMSNDRSVGIADNGRHREEANPGLPASLDWARTTPDPAVRGAARRQVRDAPRAGARVIITRPRLLRDHNYCATTWRMSER
jgi:DNA-binding CsgD family transcriptional regulator